MQFVNLCIESQMVFETMHAVKYVVADIRRLLQIQSPLRPGHKYYRRLIVN